MHSVLILGVLVSFHFYLILHAVKFITASFSAHMQVSHVSGEGGTREDIMRRETEDDDADEYEEEEEEDDDDDDDDEDENEGEVDEPKLKYERISNTLEAILNNDAASYLAVHTKVIFFSCKDTKFLS